MKHSEFVKAMQQQLNCDEDSAIVRIINYDPCIREKMMQLLMKFQVNRKHLKKYQAEQEVLSYLIATEECIYPKSEIDPLEWWRENKHIYPNVAKCARMWLSAPATSTSSERVFLICDVVDTQKQKRLSGKSIKNQLFIHNNQQYM